MLTYRQYHTLLEETDAVNTIISVAELLRSEAEGEGDAKTSMNSFLNMLRNAGLNINYDGLKAYYDAEPRLQSEIQDFNEKEVVFVGDAEGLDMKPSGEMPPEKKVNSMAKKALAKREGVNEDSNHEIIMGFIDQWTEAGQPDDYMDDLVAYVKKTIPNSKDWNYAASLIKNGVKSYQDREYGTSSLMGLRNSSEQNEGVNKMKETAAATRQKTRRNRKREKDRQEKLKLIPGNKHNQLQAPTLGDNPAANLAKAHPMYIGRDVNPNIGEDIEREIKNGKMYISRADFKKVHSDYKNDTPGKERMLGLDPETGGTTSYEVVFTDLGPGKEFRGTADDIMMKMKAYKKANDKLGIGEVDKGDKAGRDEFLYMQSRKEDYQIIEYLENLLGKLEGNRDGFAKIRIRELLADLKEKLAYESVNEGIKDELGAIAGAVKDTIKGEPTSMTDRDKRMPKMYQDPMKKYAGAEFGGTIDKMQYIVDTKSAMEIDGVLVDTFTASLIMDIFNKVNKDNQDKMRKMPVEKLASAAYKLADRVKEDVDEGYYEMPPMDRERYTDIPGLEGPFTTRSGKVIYYDPKEGKYYDRDSDMYLSYEEFKDYDKSRPEDFKITKMELPKKESVEESFDYWQSVDSIAKLAGVKKK